MRAWDNTCRGSENDERNAKLCRVCNGEGVVRDVEHHFVLGRKPEKRPITLTCPVCHGSKSEC
jgi:DnaJ-class molecular chaperone